MKGYGQYCPTARASEVLAERWTIIIVRNLLLGCRTFTEIERGAPGISKTLLAQRLRQLERVGIVERRPNPRGRGSHYSLTAAGEELQEVCDALGNWAARWLDIAPEHLEPYFVLWAICNSLDRNRLPRERVVVRLDFPDLRHHNRFWLLLDRGEGEVCVRYPGFEEDLVVTADSEWFARWHMGWVSWPEALRSGRVTVEGPRALARAFPSWNKLSHFAGVPPVQA